MITKDIKKIDPDWSIWRDGCPPSKEHKGESVQEMTDRVDGVIKEVRELHRKVSVRWVGWVGLGGGCVVVSLWSAGAAAR